MSEVPSEVLFYRAAGKFRFLSNLWPCKVQMFDHHWTNAISETLRIDNGIKHREFSSAEAAYQFVKPRDVKVGDYIAAAPFPDLCSSLGHGLSTFRVRSDWTQIKVGVMTCVLLAKFEQHEDLRRKLLDTGEASLVEESSTDPFWGIGKSGKGQNMLGKLLMQIRSTARVAN